MILFWIAVAALSVAVLAGLTWPLLRKPQLGSTLTRVDYDLSIYKDQLLEVERDIDRGVLSEDQAQAARVEVERRMLGVIQKKPQIKTMDDGVSTIVHPLSTRVLILVILGVVPLGAIALYWNLGQPGMPDFPLSGRSAEIQNQANAGPNMAQLNAMIRDIKLRLTKDPKNARDWLILGRAYELRGDLADAVGVYEKLVDVTNRYSGAVLTLAAAKFKLANQIMNNATMALFKEGQAKDPGNPMPYYYIALGQEQFNNFPAALKEYVRLLQNSPENAKWVPNVQARMKRVAKKLGVPVPVVKMMPPLTVPTNGQPKVQGGAAQGAGSSGVSPSAQQIQEAKKMTPAQRQAFIRSMVGLLAQKLKANPDDLAGWRRLANAYKVLGDQGKLAEAEANIKRLQGK